MAVYIVIEVDNAESLNAVTKMRIVVEEGSFPPRNIGALSDLILRALKNLPKSIIHIPKAVVPAKAKKG